MSVIIMADPSDDSTCCTGASGDQGGGDRTASDAQPNGNDGLTEEPYKVNWETLLQDEPYDMDRPRRGICAIFDNYKFPNQKDYREGTQYDAYGVYDIFKHKYGFDTRYFPDLEAEDTKDQLKKLKKEVTKEDSCFVCFLLTHGDKGKLFASDGGVLPYEDVYGPFLGDKCKELDGKPKIFFMQACMGRKRDTIDSDGPARVPSHADLLICTPSWIGFQSYRNPQMGTWFIQSLCAVLKRSNGEKDLLELMTFVNHEVARRSLRDGEKIIKQMPSFLSSLRGKVFLKPKDLTDVASRSTQKPSPPMAVAPSTQKTEATPRAANRLNVGARAKKAFNKAIDRLRGDTKSTATCSASASASASAFASASASAFASASASASASAFGDTIANLLREIPERPIRDRAMFAIHQALHKATYGTDTTYQAQQLNDSCDRP